MEFILQFQQYSDTVMYFVQLVAGVIFVVHAFPKLKDSKGAAKAMGSDMAAMPLILGLVELLGGVAFITGRFVEEAALLLALIMLGAIVTKVFKQKAPFTSLKSTGWEFELLLFAVTLSTLLSGGVPFGG